MVRVIATSTLQFQQDIQWSIKNLENQVNQLTTTINHFESQYGGELSYQPEANLMNVSTMTLRRGKELEEPTKSVEKPKIEEKEDAFKRGPDTSDPVSNLL
ncbi:hypothetical protein ACS0TY_004032 [Phlomoides rotata]